MHDDEIDIGVDLVRRLIADQHPQWSELPLEPVPSSGTDNAMFRLGDAMVVRMPRIHWAVEAVEREDRWLPVLAPHLPFAIPTPLASGDPGEGYPWSWSIYEWLEGNDVIDGRLNDPLQAARDIASFLNALRAIDTTDAPRAVPGGRGASLRWVDGQTRNSISAANGLVDTHAVSSVWDRVLQVPEWEGSGAWFHGDITGGNLLKRNGRLSAVIDFCGAGVGDPACDLAVAWELFRGDSKEVFREELGLDDATWDRARGWALCTAMWALPYYLNTNPPMVAQARRKIDAVLADLI